MYANFDFPLVVGVNLDKMWGVVSVPRTTHSWDDGLPMQSRVSVPPWSSPRAVEHLSFKQIGFLLGSLFVCVACLQFHIFSHALKWRGF